jgi:hypothetical protein
MYRDCLSQDDLLEEGCGAPGWLSSGRWACLPTGMVRPSSGEDLFASRPVVLATSAVIGATRAPAFSARIRAFAKRGQMTGGPGDSLDHELHLGNGVISERIRASDAYVPAQPGVLPSVQSADGARA